VQLGLESKALDIRRISGESVTVIKNETASGPEMTDVDQI
jgi:hypothetical protein